ncbi:hypothetical protein J6590_038899 [Homalodisca vitripennis]|nr:hypothetical protein J6590_038899 [Homalodisca vitripennis]
MLSRGKRHVYGMLGAAQRWVSTMWHCQLPVHRKCRSPLSYSQCVYRVKYVQFSASVHLPFSAASVADLIPGIWIHVCLKGSGQDGDEEAQNELFASFRHQRHLDYKI